MVIGLLHPHKQTCHILSCERPTVRGNLIKTSRQHPRALFPVHSLPYFTTTTSGSRQNKSYHFLIQTSFIAIFHCNIEGTIGPYRLPMWNGEWKLDYILTQVSR